MTIQKSNDPVFLVTLTDDLGNKVEHSVQGHPSYNSHNVWVEFFTNRDGSGILAAVFPTSRVLSMVRQEDGAVPMSDAA